MEWILGVDVGTHGIRVLAYDAREHEIKLRVKAEYSRKNDEEGIQEMDAGDLWKTFLEVMGKLEPFISQNINILAMGITHQRGTLIPVNEKIEALAPAYCDSDNRALGVKDLNRLGVSHTSYYQKSGCPFVSFNGLTKILWCGKNDPKLFGETYAWLSPQDYLLSMLRKKLTVTEGSLLRNGYYDVHKRQPAYDILSDKTPECLKHSCEPLGKPVGKIVEGEGIPYYLHNVRLISVSGDQPSGVIGTGAIYRDDIAVNLGTTFVASMFSETPVLDPEEFATLEVLPDNLWAPEIGTGAGGQFMDWFVRLFYGAVECREIWNVLDNSASKVSAGAEGLRVIPLLWHVISKDTSGGFTKLSSIHRQQHFLRAVYEGLAYEARISIEKIEKVAGRGGGDVRVFGGMSDLPNFLQIMSDVTGRRIICMKEKQASALGAALTAAVGTGALSSLKDAASFAGQIEKTVEPLPVNKEFYNKEYEDYVSERRNK